MNTVHTAFFTDSVWRKDRDSGNVVRPIAQADTENERRWGVVRCTQSFKYTEAMSACVHPKSQAQYTALKRCISANHQNVSMI